MESADNIVAIDAPRESQSEPKDSHSENVNPTKSEAEHELTGAGAVRKEANTVLRENAKKIAAALSRKAEQGDLQSFKALYERSLEFERQDQPDEDDDWCLADEWAQEEPWRAEMSQPRAETGIGGLEPE